MWQIREHKNISKLCERLPAHIVKKYELWKQLVLQHGPDKLMEFPGFHDEKLRGIRQGQRSSRLSLQYRIIYSVNKDEITVYVLEITPHKY